ncbi:hypothetical protein FRC03_009148 [Tulasnella sp. 419]|nr:hypothetical protein FRC03_009148 [Tulasnella sp. 419]
MEASSSGLQAAAVPPVPAPHGLRRDSTMAALPDADALRAAALKSLISKRRKIDPSQSIMQSNPSQSSGASPAGGAAVVAPDPPISQTNSTDIPLPSSSSSFLNDSHRYTPDFSAQEVQVKVEETEVTFEGEEFSQTSPSDLRGKAKKKARARAFRKTAVFKELKKAGKKARRQAAKAAGGSPSDPSGSQSNAVVPESEIPSEFAASLLTDDFMQALFEIPARHSSLGSQMQDSGYRSEPEEGEIQEDTPPPPSFARSHPPSISLAPSSHLDSRTQPRDAPARPGYLDHLTEDQLTEAKDLILDVLGYGFQPEDLKVIGLDPGLIAICFAELNLVLPDNIRPAEIPPLPYGSPVPPSFATVPYEMIRFRPKDWRAAKSRATNLASELDSPQAMHTVLEHPVSLKPSFQIHESSPSLLSSRESHSRQSSLLIPLATSPPSRPSPGPMVQTFDTLSISSPFIPQIRSSSISRATGVSDHSSSGTPLSFTPGGSPAPIPAVPSPLLAVPDSTSQGRKISPPTAPRGELQEAALREQLLARKAGKMNSTASSPAPTPKGPPDAATLNALRQAALARKKQNVVKSAEASHSTANVVAGVNQPINQDSTSSTLPAVSDSMASTASQEIVLTAKVTSIDTSGSSTPILRNPAPLRRVRATDFIDDMDGPSSSTSTPISPSFAVRNNLPIRSNTSRSVQFPIQKRASLIPLSDPSQIMECVIDVTDSESDESEDEDDVGQDQALASPLALVSDAETRAQIDAQVTELIDAATRAVAHETRSPVAATNVTDEIARLKRLIALREAKRVATASPSIPPSTPATPLPTSGLVTDTTDRQISSSEHSVRFDSNSPPRSAGETVGPSTSSDSNGHSDSLAEVEELVGEGRDSDDPALLVDSDGDHRMIPETHQIIAEVPLTLIDETSSAPTTTNVADSTEAQREHVFTVIADASSVVDDSQHPKPYSSHQIAESENPKQTTGQSFSRFSPYLPTFGGLLPHHPGQSSASASNPTINADSSISSECITHRSGRLNITPLKLSVLDRYDPGKSICKFEVPGGGVCGVKCEDAHLRDFEPSDVETAKYLAEHFPNHTVDQFEEALMHTRKAGLVNQLNYTARIANALTTLKLR